MGLGMEMDLMLREERLAWRSVLERVVAFRRVRAEVLQGGNTWLRRHAGDVADARAETAKHEQRANEYWSTLNQKWQAEDHQRRLCDLSWQIEAGRQVRAILLASLSTGEDFFSGRNDTLPNLAPGIMWCNLEGQEEPIDTSGAMLIDWLRAGGLVHLVAPIKEII